MGKFVEELSKDEFKNFKKECYQKEVEFERYVRRAYPEYNEEDVAWTVDGMLEKTGYKVYTKCPRCGKVLDYNPKEQYCMYCMGPINRR